MYKSLFATHLSAYCSEYQHKLSERKRVCVCVIVSIHCRTHVLHGYYVYIYMHSYTTLLEFRQ